MPSEPPATSIEFPPRAPLAEATGSLTGGDVATHKAIERIDKAERGGETTLDLSGLGLRKLPTSMSRLKGSLEILMAKNNALERLPDWICDFSKLQALILTHNNLSALPTHLGRLNHLNELYLAENALETLPDSIGQLTKLTELYLSGNRLATLPDSICALTRLQILWLERNCLTELPENIGNLRVLTLFGASQNQLRLLPSRLGHLTNLNKLFLDHNQIGWLPETLGDLPRLELLNLAHNRLERHLPLTLWRLTGRLKELYLHGNPALKLPDDLLGPGIEEVRRERKTPASPAKLLEWYFSNGTLEETSVF